MAPKPHHPPPATKYRVVCSKLQQNTGRANDLFKKGSGFGGQQVVLKKRPPPGQPEQYRGDGKDHDEVLADSREEKRRSTRSTQEIPPEWIKVPVEAPYISPMGEFSEVHGFVYYSIETRRLFKKHKGLVYMEGTINGLPEILGVEEHQLPMMTEEHPDYAIRCNQIKNERKRRMSHARHMKGLQTQNEENWHETELKLAQQTYDRELERIKAKMLDRVNKRLKAVQGMMKKEEGHEQPPQQNGKASSSPLAESESKVTSTAATTPEPPHDEDHGGATVADYPSPYDDGEDDEVPYSGEEETARRVLYDTLIKRSTLLPPRPWAPLWDAPKRKKTLTKAQRDKLEQQLLVKQQPPKVVEEEYIQEDDYVDMVELIKRRAV